MIVINLRITENGFYGMLFLVLPILPLLKHVTEIDSDRYEKMLGGSLRWVDPARLKELASGK